MKRLKESQPLGVITNGRKSGQDMIPLSFKAMHLSFSVGTLTHSLTSQDDPDLLNVAWLVKRAPHTAQFDSWSSEWIRRCRPREPGELRALPHTGHM